MLSKEPKHEPEEIDIYKILETRARFVRRTNIALVILLIMAATLVSTLIIGYKDNQKNWITDLISVAGFNRTQLSPGDLVMFQSKSEDGSRKVGVYLGKDSEGSDDIASTSENNEIRQKIAKAKLLEQLNSWQGVRYGANKSQTEKIADSIATVLLTLSLIIFVGFVMRAVLVFIRYYMQLGTDFENQRLAYVISKKESISFGAVLQDLRNNDINFEKTPMLPQEKIIVKLIDALGQRNNATGKE